MSEEILQKINDILTQKIKSIENGKLTIFDFYDRLEDLSVLQFSELLAVKRFKVEYYDTYHKRLYNALIDSTAKNYKIEFELDENANELVIWIERIDGILSLEWSIGILFRYKPVNNSIEFESVNI